VVSSLPQPRVPVRPGIYLGVGWSALVGGGARRLEQFYAGSVAAVFFAISSSVSAVGGAAAFVKTTNDRLRSVKTRHRRLVLHSVLKQAAPFAWSKAGKRQESVACFRRRGGLGDRLAQRLRQQNQPVVTVTAGEWFVGQ
jgi:hypothetical protein